ncbi:hypothetical protein MMC28_004865 [Mycoblastus sanguinarius]|nr:hypothetical protein [Mycoblastus sanguinarius]
MKTASVHLITVAIDLRPVGAVRHLHTQIHILLEQTGVAREVRHTEVGMEAPTEEDQDPPQGHIHPEETHARDHLFQGLADTQDPLPRGQIERSPGPTKRDRVSPPRNRYERRDYSPPRNTRARFPNENNYRPGERSRSPVRRSEHVSRIASPISSHRSSPHVHPDRVANTASRTHSPAFRNTHPPPAARDSGYRDRSPPRRGYSPVPISPPHEPVASRPRSPPQRERNDHRNGTTPATWSDVQIATPQSHGYRNGDSRPPPSGPGSAYRESYARHSQSGVPPSAPISMSAHNRPTSANLLSAPTRPRGGPSFAGRDSRDHAHSGPPTHRGGRGAPSPYHGPPPRQHYDSRPPPSDHVPHGPRSSHGGPSPFDPPYRAPPPFRSNNSSSTTYPRTQRFTNHLASVPAIVPGGEVLPSALDPAAKKRLAELEEGRKKLLEEIEEKQREKRKNLREWESRERESRRDGLRSELAEGALEAMSEGVGTGTAF